MIGMKPELIGLPIIAAMCEFLEGCEKFRRWSCPDADPGTTSSFLSREATTRVVVSGLLLVWSAAESSAPTYELGGVSLDFCDVISGIPSFGDAMESVALVRDTGMSIVFTIVGGHIATESKTSKGDALDDYSPEFEEFWNAYPRKTGKGAAWKSWKKAKPGKELRTKILTAVGLHKRQPNWFNDKGKFVPHASTWLNERRWDDEVEGRLVDMKPKVPQPGVRRYEQEARASVAELRHLIDQARGKLISEVPNNGHS